MSDDEGERLPPETPDLSALRVACVPWILAGLVNIGVGWVIGAVAWQIILLVGVLVWVWLVFAGAPVWPSAGTEYVLLFLSMCPVFVVPAVGLIEVILGIAGLLWPGPWLRWLPVLCVFSCVFFDAVSLLAALASTLLLWRAAQRAHT
jgi:hypothetical protein